MNGVREQLIRELDRERHGFGEVGIDATAVRSPTCGDEVAVAVDVRDGVIRSLAWRGHGCTVSMASASALATLSPGLTSHRLAQLRILFAESLTRQARDDLPPDDHPLGDAAVFEGIGRLPLRGRCASLAWDALAAALDGRLDGNVAGQRSSVSTS